MTGTDEHRLGMLESALGAMNVGIVVLDQECRVVLWNQWMVRHSGDAAQTVLGRELFVLRPELNYKRLESAVRQALRDNFPSVLSQTLHKAPLALFATASARVGGERIQQAITVTPLEVADAARHCLIQITDVSAAVNRERLLRDQAIELRSQTYLDGLTGIANRRHFNITVDNEIRRAKRAGLPLSLLMIDIDFFKAYNDHYGHQRGDDALIRVAAALAAMLRRPLDFIARYGGEEFVVILPELDAAQGQQMAEAMRLAVAELALPHVAASAQHVTVSIGIATQTVENPLEAHTLIGAADRALYTAKRTGRDRAVAEIPVLQSV
jgi:diguanylate cyclase (GGDEF)-like protein